MTFAIAKPYIAAYIALIFLTGYNASTPDQVTAYVAPGLALDAERTFFWGNEHCPSEGRLIRGVRALLGYPTIEPSRFCLKILPGASEVKVNVEDSRDENWTVIRARDGIELLRPNGNLVIPSEIHYVTE